MYSHGAEIVSWYSARLRIERLSVQTAAEAVREFSSPELTLCAESYLGSVPPPCYCSDMQKTLVILPKVQVAGYT